MAVHEVCPRDEGVPFEERIVVGTALIAARCKNLAKGICKSDGKTGGSLRQYCLACSEHYQICEVCGELLAADACYPTGKELLAPILQTVALIEVRRDGKDFVAFSKILPQFHACGETTKELLESCFSALELVLVYYQQENLPFPELPLK